jgi:transcriptional antiterminator Rof (Rho-off)
MVDYEVVSCDFYDEIILAIEKKMHCVVTTIQTIQQGRIIDVYTKEKVEYCVINGFHIRLDKIVGFKYDGETSKYLGVKSCGFKNNNVV